MGWVGGLCIGRTSTEKERGWALALFIVINLGILCWFKYSNIAVETVNSGLGGISTLSIAWEKIILPIGLSFIALQSISYLIDVYRRTVPVDRSFVSFAAYQSMFVHLIAVLLLFHIIGFKINCYVGHNLIRIWKCTCCVLFAS